MSKIPTLTNLDRAEPRHPEKVRIQPPPQQYTLLVDHSNSTDRRQDKEISEILLLHASRLFPD